MNSEALNIRRQLIEKDKGGTEHKKDNIKRKIKEVLNIRKTISM